MTDRIELCNLVPPPPSSSLTEDVTYFEEINRDFLESTAAAHPKSNVCHKVVTIGPAIDLWSCFSS